MRTARFNSLLIALLAACKAKSAGLHITLDGELKEPEWNARAERHVLVGDDGQSARPYAELRLLHDATTLYIGLYAADEDIRSSDAFDVTIGSKALHLTAAGPHVDHDGTIDQPQDFDEEWVVEEAVPLPPSPVAIAVTRCDTPKDGVKRCAAWRGTVTLAPQ